MNKGFVVLAQNTNKVNYVKCAETLALSVKNTMPTANISLITNDVTSLNIWDKVIPLPYGDLHPDSDWKLENDWQVYEASPYEFTIKLEADLYLPTSIDYYWDVLTQRDLVICTTIRNFKQDVVSIKPYRKFITDNNLPDTYNAITYFKKSKVAEDFFSLVKDIFINWNQYKTILQCNPNEQATTDWVYALACHILGEEITTLPNFTSMSMVHMKPLVNDFVVEDWTKCLVYEIFPNLLKINTLPQLFPFHYINKSFCNKLVEVL